MNDHELCALQLAQANAKMLSLIIRRLSAVPSDQPLLTRVDELCAWADRLRGKEQKETDWDEATRVRPQTQSGFIKVDGKQYAVGSARIAGEQIRQIADIKKEYDLWLDCTPDSLHCKDDEMFEVANSPGFYTAPRAING